MATPFASVVNLGLTCFKVIFTFPMRIVNQGNVSQSMKCNSINFHHVLFFKINLFAHSMVKYKQHLLSQLPFGCNKVGGGFHLFKMATLFPVTILHLVSCTPTIFVLGLYKAMK